MAEINPVETPTLVTLEPVEQQTDTVVEPVPPDEQFWEKYSRNYEFPLSTFGSLAAHILVVGVLIGIWKYIDNQGKQPPPIRAVVVGDGEAAGDGTFGSGTSNPNEAGKNNDAAEYVKPIPDAQFQEIKSSVVEWAPDLKTDPELVNILANSPEIEKLKQLNDDLRKKLLDGLKSDKGKGKGTGKGDNPDDGSGSSGKGTGSTTGERSLRWNLVFTDYRLAEDYLDQIAQLKGKIIYPTPPNWETCVALTEFKPGSKGVETDLKKITEMYYICQEANQVQVLVEALSLKFTPPYYVLLLPKEVEDYLAALELAYNNKKSEEIKQTWFKFVSRDGKVVPIVIKQTLRGR